MNPSTVLMLYLRPPTVPGGRPREFALLILSEFSFCLLRPWPTLRRLLGIARRALSPSPWLRPRLSLDR